MRMLEGFCKDDIGSASGLYRASTRILRGFIGIPEGFYIDSVRVLYGFHKASIRFLQDFCKDPI